MAERGSLRDFPILKEGGISLFGDLISEASSDERGRMIAGESA